MPTGKLPDRRSDDPPPPPPAARPVPEATADDLVPEPAEGVVGTVVIQETTTHHHAGPLPPPQTLAAYDRLLPGAADRILTMAESQLAHHQSFQSDQLTAAKEKMRWEAASELLGTLSALTASTLLTVGGVYAIVHGYPAAGTSVITTTVVTLAAVFVYGRRTGMPKHPAPTAAAPHQDERPPDQPEGHSRPAA